MKKIFAPLIMVSCISIAFMQSDINMQLVKAASVDSLGACQGASFQKGKLFLYGDREVGMIREYKIEGDSIIYQNNEIKLTINGKDVINHPTGIAVHSNMPTFIGNSIRLNPEGTLWKAVIYSVNWEHLQKTKTLDENLLNTIEDDTCIQGTRPEYVEYKNKWYVATADYGDKTNEVRLYDPALLATAKKTSDKKVLYKKFSCTPWVQNLQWIPEKNILVLIQNQIEGKKWRFTYIDLAQSIESGKQATIKVIDINERSDELEGFTFLNNLNKGIAVTSSRKNNANMMNIKW